MFFVLMDIAHPSVMLSLFLAAEVVLEHKGDACISSIKVLTFPYFTSSLPNIYKLQIVATGFLAYRS